jgi:uncharacterized protein
MKTLIILFSVILFNCSSEQKPQVEENSLENHKNHLASETSPYLLQHADNPVDWFPWGETAFNQAKSQNKPILLSIGYAACHWCHVMEHESFEDEETAKIMNDLFVCIKVDREERPDIDQIYMTYVQMTTGSGGWPLNVFLTPDLEPFYGGTYFPPDDRYGRPSWKNVLQQVSNFYHQNKDALKDNIKSVREAFEKTLTEDIDTDIPKIENLEKAANQLIQQFDRNHGGLGQAPKFPAIQPLRFLLNYYKRTSREEYLHAVTFSLKKMAEGGIYDQIGGGFARYSVDEKWLVPHFEKMLYDNAQLVPLYLDMYLVTKDVFYADVARDILNFVMREMTSPDGGFYSSLDADSEGEEGKFYVWSRDEVDNLLGSNSEIFCDFYDITSQGNFEGTNILHAQTTISATATRFKKSEDEIQKILDESRILLLNARGSRIRPGLDDKILTSWNALMLTGFAKAYQIFRVPEYKEVITKNISFLKTYLKDDQYLLRTHNRGKSQIDGYLEDYAYLIRALFDSYEAVFDASYLEWAKNLLDITNSEFIDPENGGYFVTRENRDDLLFRMKDEYDQSIPSAISVMLHNNLRFYSLTEDSELIEHSEKILKKYGQKMLHNAYGYASYLYGLEFYHQKPKEILLVYPENIVPEIFYQSIFSNYEPFKVVISIEEKNIPEFLSASLFQGKSLKDGRPTAYICRDFACSLPINDLAEFNELYQSD